MLPLLLLFLLRDTLAVAPGDEYDGCEVPDYPVNIKVLLDSWRYGTLHGQNEIGTADWTTVGTDTVSQNCGKYTVKTCMWLLFRFSGIPLGECVVTVQLPCVLKVKERSC